ncbi:Alpha-mannosidase [Thalictrum thalictroides]|uniref:Alpha-mannosidase n=1 Tax=Thalictrum thalictroides TaxID=46969 RepID=A0A7J6VUY2_THATH|nr:Alpha-mannosidase [Thalictrum thalictroides]
MCGYQLQVINESITIHDSSGKEIESQLIPIANASLKLRNYYVQAYLGKSLSVTPKYWLAFMATAPPLGFSTYILSNVKNSGSLTTLSTIYTSLGSENDSLEVGQGNLKLTYAVDKGKLIHYTNSRSLVSVGLRLFLQITVLYSLFGFFSFGFFPT